MYMIIVGSVILFHCIYYRVEFYVYFFFFFQAEDGIRDLVRSRGLGDVYKRQTLGRDLLDPNKKYNYAFVTNTADMIGMVSDAFYLSLIHI